MKNKNIIIFSSIDWDTHRQLHHELVDNLINSGNKILFIENTGSRSFKLTDIFRIKKRFIDWFKSKRGYSIMNSNITIYSPIFIPINFFKPIVIFNSFILSGSIIKWLKVTYFDSPIVISFLPSPLIQNIINKINPQLKIYYCADLMYKPNYSPKNIKKWELKFIKSVDHIFYTSIKIGQYIKNNTNLNNYTYIPNGVDFDKFNNHEKANIKKDFALLDLPIIGYIGAIRSILDFELLEFLIKNINANFVFVGPILDKKFLKLSRYKNCIFLGNKKHSDIPGYIKLFNICMIPYIKNDFTDAIYPVKLNEYLSLGKKVVATDISELIEFNKKDKILSLCSSKESFKNKINYLLLNKQSNEISEKTITEVARNNSWEVRFKKVKEIITSYLNAGKNSVPENWETYSKNYKIKLYRGIIKNTAILSTIFFIIFISPLYWFIGDQLIVKNNTSNHDIGVILSGTSTKNFIEKDYQNRVIRAINLYNEGKINKIYLSSGYVQNEFGISYIKKLLDSEKINVSDYYIEKNASNTTYDNLLNIYLFLESKDLDSIILFTDNYHSRRVELIWNSKFSDIKKIILVDEVVDKKWKIGLDNIKKINYEYLAILYNFFINRI